MTWEPLAPDAWHLLERINVGLSGRGHHFANEGSTGWRIGWPWIHVEAYGGDYDSAYRSPIFLGPIQSPSGQQHLLLLTFDGPAFIWGGKKIFHATTYPTHASWSAYDPVFSRSSAGLDFSDPRPLSIFGAQRDAKDPSHLTIVYQFGPDKGIIDARLDDAGKIVLARQP